MYDVSLLPLCQAKQLQADVILQMVRSVDEELRANVPYLSEQGAAVVPDLQTALR